MRRSIGELCGRQEGGALNYLGLQEPPQKYCPGINTPGPWTAPMAYTNEGGGARVFIAKKKWNKGKGIICGFGAPEEGVCVFGS
jgi:hypothetical protein